MDIVHYLRDKYGVDMDYATFLELWEDETIRSTLIDQYKSDINAALEIVDKDLTYLLTVKEPIDPKRIHDLYFWPRTSMDVTTPELRGDAVPQWVEERLSFPVATTREFDPYTSHCFPVFTRGGFTRYAWPITEPEEFWDEIAERPYEPGATFLSRSQ